MRKAFTMVEIIVVIVIMSILSLGTLISVKHLYQRAAKTSAINTFSSNSEVVLDQISALLYDRVSTSVIGYDPTNGDFQSIYNINSNFTVLEWIGTASEALKKRDYDGFADLNASNRATDTIVSYDLNDTDLNTTEYDKFGITYTYTNPNDANVTALIFAGAFDTGVVDNDFNNSFGWHGNSHNLIYDITGIVDNNITLAVRPQEIYEKYYLVDSAYAVARGQDVNIATCRAKTKLDADDTLYLFYNYRPWKGETFCADPNGSGMDGDVTILAEHVTAFKTDMLNDSIYFELTMSKNIRGSDNNVTVSKQKVVF
jgi:prepilin-type N-terminal cleavage/methylation domain-containing protein